MMPLVVNGTSATSDDEWPCPHLSSTRKTWEKLQDLLHAGSVSINGRNLDIATIVAISRNKCRPSIEQSPQVLQGIESSVATLENYLAKSYFVYGVNTGFGGSADSRTTDFKALQTALMQHVQSAVITSLDKGEQNSGHQNLSLHSMPLNWIRGSMIIRCNANIRGHSGMTLPVVQTIVELLAQNIIPIVPLRGSISASGDLMPLSYIAGAIQGSPDIFVQMGNEEGCKITTAEEALRMKNIKPIELGPKEGLSLINGTAPSAAVASLALYETNHLAVLAQYLTCLAEETTAGNAEWSHSFIARVRPHEGQIEVSRNIRTLLKGSKLITGLETSKDRFKVGLAQDRYALRSSAQWIGPQLEDLLLAQHQVTTELNSTSDNPVVDVSEQNIHSCANFQAVSITSASEKARLCLQMLGKLLFAQCTEMINPTLNNGLPANLAADDPSLSFCMKGVDVNMAAYMSELAYLANPVSSHVQSAEMHNQAVNSLALISCRYTMQAVELVSLMSACFLYVGCQGVDLRVMHSSFLRSLEPVTRALIIDVLGKHVPEKELVDVHCRLWKEITNSWSTTGALDLHQRCEKAALASIAIVTDALHSSPDSSSNISLSTLHHLKTSIRDQMFCMFTSHRKAFFAKQDTAQYLGKGSKVLYHFVRDVLKVPFHQGLVEHPTPFDKDGNKINGRDKKTIGSWVSIIYESLRSGRLYDEMMQAMDDKKEMNGTSVQSMDDKKEMNGTNVH